MAWTSPLTWVAGQVLTAAQMNTHVRDNLRVTTHAIVSDNVVGETANTTAETTAWSLTIPANTLGTVGMIVLNGVLKLHDLSASAPQFTIRYKYGGQTFLSHDHGVDDQDAAAICRITILARGATNTQQAFGEQMRTDWDAANTGGTDFRIAHKQLSVDSTSNQLLVVTVQMTVADAATSFQKQGALVQAVST